SRRRHTRCYRDWSSDVCSSDLIKLTCFVRNITIHHSLSILKYGKAANGSLVWFVLSHNEQEEFSGYTFIIEEAGVTDRYVMTVRSEERRVGKECRARWGTK